MIANYTRSKTYSKKEADEAIHEILKDTLYAEDEQATLRGKSREEVVNMLWQGLNAAEPGKRGAVANSDKICGVRRIHRLKVCDRKESSQRRHNVFA